MDEMADLQEAELIEMEKQQTLQLESLRLQSKQDVLRRENEIKRGFTEAEQYRLLASPVNCMTFRDRCFIDYDGYCTKQVDCRKDASKCIFEKKDICN